MANKNKTTRGKRQRIRFSHLVWMTLTAAFLIASLVLTLKILFGENYREEALKNAQRLEFALDYENGNATPHNLEGETLTMEMVDALLAAQAGVPPAAPPLETMPSAPQPEAEPQQQPETTSPDPIDAAEVNEPAASIEPNAQPPATVAEAPVSAEQQTASTSAPNLQPPLTPVERLTEDGVLPTPATDGTKPWQFNRVKTDAPTGHPRIAIVIMGAGLSNDASNLALSLPKEVTISVSPYSREAAEWVSKAKELGHEVLLDLPMESQRYPQVDMGPLGLGKAYSPEENAKRLRRVLSKARGIAGVISPEPDALSMLRSTATPFVQALSEFGVLFVSGHSRQPEGMFRITRQFDLPVVYSDIRLDTNLSETTIRNQLAHAEDLAHNRGYAVVVTNSYPLIIELMGNWIRGLKGKGYVLVPVSALAGS